MKKLTALSLYVFFTYCIAGLSFAELKLVSEAAGGKLYKAGAINVIQLRGSYRQMGQQYGKLLGKEINKLHSELINQYMANKAIKSYDDFAGMALYYFNVYPKRFQEILYGISETSGADIKKLAVINAMMMIQRSGCSEIAGWGAYAGGDPLSIGRNFDCPNYFAKFSPYLVLAVFNPTDGSRSAATLGYIGQLAALSAFNDKGLVIAENDGCLSGDKNKSYSRLPAQMNNLRYMFDFSSLQALDFALKTSLPSYPMIYAAASAERAYSYELSTYGIKRNDGKAQGLLAATNHFVNPDWKMREPSDAKDKWFKSVSRYNNLLKLGKKLKGRLNAKNIMTILDSPISGGGVFFPGQQTIYQFVAIPKDLKIWIKAVGHEGWNEIDLSKLFANTSGGEALNKKKQR